MPTKTTYNPLEWPGWFNKLILSDSGDLGTSMINGPIFWGTSDVRVDGGSVPDWKGKLKRGEQATSSLDGVRYRYSGAQRWAEVSLKKQAPTGTDDYGKLIWWGALGISGGLAVPSNADFSILAKANSIAASVFNGRALKEQRALQGAVSLGELAQTARMIKNPMQSLRRLADNYLGDVTKRAKGKKSNKQKKDAIVDTWLEHSLGWKPLINDINGLRDTLGRTLTEDTRKDIYGSGTNKGMISGEQIYQPGTVTTFRQAYKVVDLCSVRFVGQVRVKGGDPGLKDLLGLSGSNVLPSLWELIPYSFVADYFANIGQVIDAISLRRSDLIWAEKRQKISRTTTFLPLDVSGRDSGTWKVLSAVGGGGTATITRDDVHRSAQLGWPVPSLQFKIPGLGNSNQWLNLAGLLASSRRASYAIRG